eukprot:COSAG02_NODE_28399_length_590_cov_1.032587_1_plen_170_part_01
MDDQPNELLLNDGTGTFTRATTSDAVARKDKSSGVVLGDFTGDGKAFDIFVCNDGEANNLLLNDGAGRLFLSTGDAVARIGDNSLGAVVGDFAGDGGALDIYVYNNGRNEMIIDRPVDHKAISLTSGEAVASGSFSTAAVVGDFTGDGTANDIYVCTKGGPNELFVFDNK